MSKKRKTYRVISTINVFSCLHENSNQPEEYWLNPGNIFEIESGIYDAKKGYSGVFAISPKFGEIQIHTLDISVNSKKITPIEFDKLAAPMTW